MKRFILVAVGIGMLVGGSAIIGTFIPKASHKEALNNSQTAALREFTDKQQGVALHYSKPLTRQSPAPNDAKDAVIVRLASVRPEALVTLRSETGLKVVAMATKSSIVDLLLANLKKAYPSRFPEFKLLETKNLTISGHRAAEVTFTYRGPAGDEAKQRLLMIEKDDNSALYLSGQARAADFEAVNRQMLDPVFSTFTIK